MEQMVPDCRKIFRIPKMRRLGVSGKRAAAKLLPAFSTPYCYLHYISNQFLEPDSCVISERSIQTSYTASS